MITCFWGTRRWMRGRRPARCATTRRQCELMESALARFYDAAGGAFFDTETPAEGERRLGALVTRRKPLQDSPTPAGNPMAAGC